jgi:MoxR-like ATPase
LALFRTTQALAAIRGRNFVLPDDVKMIAPPVLGHRLILKPESRLRKITTDQIIAQILSEVALPVIGNEVHSP